MTRDNHFSVVFTLCKPILSASYAWSHCMTLLSQVHDHQSFTWKKSRDNSSVIWPPFVAGGSRKKLGSCRSGILPNHTSVTKYKMVSGWFVHILMGFSRDWACFSQVQAGHFVNTWTSSTKTACLAQHTGQTSLCPGQSPGSLSFSASEIRSHVLLCSFAFSWNRFSQVSPLSNLFFLLPISETSASFLLGTGYGAAGTWLAEIHNLLLP